MEEHEVQKALQDETVRQRKRAGRRKHIIDAPPKTIGELVDLHPMPLVPYEPPKPPTLVEVFERLARDPNVDVGKLQQLIELQRGVVDREAEAAFWADFALMQTELPSISRDGAVLNKSGAVQSRYATNQNIQNAIRPILQKYGFALSFRNVEARPGFTTTTGLLAHKGGHVERDTFTGPDDTSGNKNDTQAIGSTRSYGMRYCSIALLNLITEEDDDARSAGRTKIQDPAGFESWWTDLQAVGDNGLTALRGAWDSSRPDFRNHVQAHYRDSWNELKLKASKIGGGHAESSGTGR